MSCSAKKVRCSHLGAKSAEIVVSSDEEVATPRPKKPKASGIVPKAGKVSVEVRSTADGSAEILDAIRQQNSLLNDLLIYQQQAVIATAILAEWARPIASYMGRIAHALEARNEAGGSGSGSGGSGSGSGKKGKGKEREESAENGSGNGDEDGEGDENEDEDGDSERDADGDETMGKSM